MNRRSFLKSSVVAITAISTYKAGELLIGSDTDWILMRHETVPILEADFEGYWRGFFKNKKTGDMRFCAMKVRDLSEVDKEDFYREHRDEIIHQLELFSERMKSRKLG